MNFISKRHFIIIIVGLSVGFIIIGASDVANFRKRITKEYFAHKNFYFNLRNSEKVSKKTPSEKEVREIFERNGIKVEAIYKNEGGLEVKAKNVEWRFLPQLIRDIETRHTIKSMSAVDNTGKGFFELRIVIQ